MLQLPKAIHWWSCILKNIRHLDGEVLWLSCFDWPKGAHWLFCKNNHCSEVSDHLGVGKGCVETLNLKRKRWLLLLDSSLNATSTRYCLIQMLERNLDVKICNSALLKICKELIAYFWKDILKCCGEMQGRIHKSKQIFLPITMVRFIQPHIYLGKIYKLSISYDNSE